MATTTRELERLQRENARLKKQIARLKVKNGRRRAAAPKREATALKQRAAARNENQIADEILRRAGLLSKLTAREKERVARWEAVPEEKRARILNEFYHLELDKPLSDIIIENRI